MARPPEQVQAVKVFQPGEEFEDRWKRQQERCEYLPGEEADFIEDAASRFRDAIKYECWGRPLGPGFLAIAKRRNWVLKAIKQVLPMAAADGLDASSLLWLRRFVAGESPPDESSVQGVLDLVDRLAFKAVGEFDGSDLAAESDSVVAIDAPAATHSDDYRSVNWFGAEYQFTEGQAACVRVLWEAWEKGCPELDQYTILNDAELSSGRLDAVFRVSRNGSQQKHPAWGRMIVRGETKGAYRLEGPPKKTSSCT